MSKKKQKLAQATSPRRIGIYARVSTQRQASEGDSLEAQQNAINRFIEDRKQLDDWKVESVTPYIDAARSGKDLNRPQLQRLQEDRGESTFITAAPLGVMAAIVKLQTSLPNRLKRQWEPVWHKSVQTRQHGSKSSLRP